MANTDFSILVNTTVDTSNVQKALKNKTYKVKVDLDIQSAQRQMKNLDVSIEQTLKHSRKFTTAVTKDYDRISQQLSNTTIFDKGKLVQAKQYTEQYTNALGDVIERISTLNVATNKLDITEQKIVSGTAKITTQTQSLKGVVNGFTTDITKTTKTLTDTSGATKQVVTTTSKWIDANNQLHTTITTTDEKGKQLSATLEEVEQKIRKVNNTSKEAEKAQKSLVASFVETIGKVAKFYVATIPIQLMQTAITNASEAVHDFDDALTEFKKVSDLSGKSLDAYTKKLGNLGDAVARTKTEMVEAATEFKKSGFSDEDSATLAQIASLYQNIADEELSASEASSVIISQMKAFNFTAEEGIHVIDAINEV